MARRGSDPSAARAVAAIVSFGKGGRSRFHDSIFYRNVVSMSSRFRPGDCRTPRAPAICRAMPDLLAGHRRLPALRRPFAATATRHAPNPVVWFRPGARILVASQAPGLRVHHGKSALLGSLWPASARLDGCGRGDILRPVPHRDPAGWPSVFPATTPRAVTCRRRACAPQTWRAPRNGDAGGHRADPLDRRLRAGLAPGRPDGVTERVAAWRDHAPAVFPLPPPVLAQYRVAQEEPVVRGRAFAGAAHPRAGGADPMTPLDDAHGAMEAVPGDDAARLRFYDRLAGCELFLLLEEEPEGDRIRPRALPGRGADLRPRLRPRGPADGVRRGACPLCRAFGARAGVDAGGAGDRAGREPRRCALVDPDRGRLGRLAGRHAGRRPRGGRGTPRGTGRARGPARDCC